jgi:hypothetical protein
VLGPDPDPTVRRGRVHQEYIDGPFGPGSAGIVDDGAGIGELGLFERLDPPGAQVVAEVVGNIVAGSSIVVDLVGQNSLQTSGSWFVVPGFWFDVPRSRFKVMVSGYLGLKSV